MDKKNKKTLVCMAFGFYPDHVSMSWQMSGETITDGVATDSAALWDGNHYRITSRLRVSLRHWITPSRNFSCTISFFNGTATVNTTKWLESIEGPGAATKRGKYLRITHTAKLSYAAFIAKSSIFGAFVVLLVWRLQASSEKHST